VRKQNLTKSLIRAFGVMAAVAVIVSGVTFAALQSQQAKLTGNIIQTATANLQVSPNGSSYANSLDGFAFQNLVPGGVAVPNVDHLRLLSQECWRHTAFPQASRQQYPLESG